jgi:hypothetical protein
MTGCISVEAFIPVSLMVQLPQNLSIVTSNLVMGNDVHPALWESMSHDGIGDGIVGVKRVCVCWMVNP